MENWSYRLPVKIPLTITIRQCTVAVTFFTLARYVLTYYGVEYVGNQTGYLLALGIQAILLFNAFIPHIPTTTRFRMGSPGVITSILIMLPFLFICFAARLIKTY